MRPLIAWCLLALLVLGQSPLARCRSELRKARSQGVEISWLVVEARSGKRLAALDSTRSLIPASNMKIVTAGAALLGLGADHEIFTDLVAQGALDGPLLKGDLRLRGEGDPTLVSTGRRSAPLFLAQELARRGIRRIQGDLIIDDSAFSDARTGPQWPTAPAWKSWMAEVAALSLDHGTVTIVTRPGSGRGRPARVAVAQEGSGVLLRNEAETVRSKKDHRVIIDRGRRRSEVVVSGGVWSGTKESRFEIAVEDPAYCFGNQLVHALKAKGITLDGAIRRPRDHENFEQGELLCRLATPVKTVLPVLLQRSQNHRAEMLFKHCGFAVAGKGSFKGGAEAVGRIMKRNGIGLQGIALRDGSGLSRGNRLNARFLVALLRRLHASPDAALFRQSLAAGGQGTLRRRFKALGSRIAAKTGTLRGVSGLSGYLRTKGGKELIFSLLSNRGAGSKVNQKALEVRVIEALASYGG